ncbi:MAG: phosphomannomutase [Pseudomonadota bacterium]
MVENTVRSILSASQVSFGTSGLRGLVTDLNDQVCYAVTRGFLDHGVKSRGVTTGSKVLFAYDLRPSSPEIALAVAKAITDAGMQPICCGTIPTPALALASTQQSLPAVMITGSHIPFDRNGIKFYYADGEITKADEAPIASSEVIVSGALVANDLGDPDPAPEEEYFQRYMTSFAGVLDGQRVGHFQHSAVGRDLTARLLQALGAEVTALERTSHFVPIDTEAVSQADREKAKAWSSEFGFDIIVSTDGDGDRPLLADEKGNFFQGDLLGVFSAKYLSARTIVTPVSSNSVVEQSKWFDQVIRTKIGSPHVIKSMEGMDAVIGYEANGGTLLGSDFTLPDGSTLSPLPTRDAILPILATVALAKRENIPLSKLSDSLPPRFTRSDRLVDWPTHLSLALLADLSEDEVKLSEFMEPFGKVVSTDETDGLRASLESGDIVHLRPSGNAPEFRVYVESSTTDRADELLSQALDHLSKRAP